MSNSNQSVFEKFKAYVIKEHMIARGDRIFAGVSGGADSVCLFFLLLKLQKNIPFSLSVIHVEHGLRGDESLADAAFVEQLCHKENVPYFIRQVDVKGLVASQHLSEEDAARRLRRDAFISVIRQEAGEEKAKVALAHHAEDQAETVLMALLRGAGIKGLGGIRPCADLSEDIMLVRPLLFIRRAEIENYLYDEKIAYCKDRTNDDVRYTRNRIRHQILPVLEEINPGAIMHISQTAGMLRDLNASVYAGAMVRANAIIIDGRIATDLLAAEKNEIAVEILRIWLQKETGTIKDIEQKHYEKLLAMCEGTKEAALDLPGAYRVRCMGKNLICEPKTNDIMPQMDAILVPEMEKGEHFAVSINGYDIRLFVRERIENEDYSEKIYAKCFDYDKMDSIMIRGRRAHDRLVVRSDGGTKLLRRYFIDEKIPEKKRDRIPLICDEDEVIWVIGYRDSMAYRITEDTKTVLAVEVWRSGSDE